MLEGKKVVLAYSGGLDTSVCLKWLEQRGAEPYALYLDLGQGEPEGDVKGKALKIGAADAFIKDAKAEFAEEYVAPAIRANALYGGKYPLFTALGRNNEEMVKQYRRAYSRKALKALEPAALELGPQSKVELEPVLTGLAFSADRAGVLMCGDVSVGLTMVLREDPNFATVRLDNAEPLVQALRERADLQQILTYVLSDDFLRLRQRVGLALP